MSVVSHQVNTPNAVTSAAQQDAQIRVLSQFLGLPFVERLPEPAPPRNPARGDFDRIAGSWGRQFLTVPIGGSDSEVIVATADPLNVGAIEQLRMCYERPIKVVVATSDEIAKAINAIRTSLMSDRSSNLSDSGKKEEGEDFQNQLEIDVTDSDDDDAPIIRYVNAIIFKASSERASDVHIEPYEDKLKVRFRIDGVLYDVASEDKAFQASIISRVKVMSGLNIAEKRLPQDGRIGLKIAGKEVDIRVSTVPTQFGERIVMRLLDKTGAVLNLDQLGISPKILENLKKLIQKPNGIILVTGPTGSGKTTTLYAGPTYINKPDLNILTVEDPIEYQLVGVGQMQVNPKIDFTFANGLRAILRQDPDVVMVGEIRDTETAEISIQASLTGHLVLSTLHTNDSAGAVSRLLDMGVEPFLVSSSLLGVLAQRLVRKLCLHCRAPYEISDEELRELSLDPATVTSRLAYRSGNKECPHCQSTGYVGRAGIHELLLIDDEVRTHILQRVDANSIKNAAMKRGFMSLRSDGGLKVLSGLTSVEEVLMASHEDSCNHMPVYEYLALNPNGKQVKGTVDADSIRSARQKLRGQNVFPTDIKESLQASKEKTKDVKRYLKGDRVSLKELAVATRLLATLANAGLPLVSALLALSDQVESTTLKRIVVDIKEKVEQGSSLAKALAGYPKVFPRLYANMVASGEASGTLDSVLENLADYYEAQTELRRKISSALFYPILMFVFCTLVVIALVTFVVPSIVAIFIKQKIALPLPTQIVIAFSNALTGYWWLLIGIIVLALYMSRYAYQQPAGREWFDRVSLKLPLFGPIYRKVSTARVATTLGTLLNGGVDLLNALDIVKNIVGNVHMKRALEEARDGAREGRSLAKELSKSGYFPNLLSQMVAIGEKSGKMEGMLGKAGKAFSNEVNATIAGLTTLIEPVMIIVLGGIVFGIVISVLLPMTELMQVVQPGE